jgi:multidrug efflux pump subunit AcrA (membrane-fusion protein)
MLSLHKNIAFLFIFTIVLAGCQSLFASAADADTVTPTPVPTPIIPDKPTYIVQQGQVIKQTEFSGRISAVEETTLYFKTNGFVKRVLFERGDLVKEGDLLAELEIDDLLKAMAQAQVSLDSAQLRLDEAQRSLERQIAQAELDHTAAETRLGQAEIANADSIVQAEINLNIAQEQFARLQANQANINAEVVSADIGLTRAEESLAEAQTAYETAFDPGREWELYMTEPSCQPGQGDSSPCTGTPLSVQMERERDSAENAVQRAEENLTIAQARQNQALAAQQVQQYDLRIQELRVAQAEADLATLQRGVDPMLAIDVQRVEQELSRLAEGVDPILVNDVSQAQLSLERLQAQVADAQIVSPMDGKILTLNLRPGRNVEAFAEVVVIADPAAIELSAALSDSQMEDLSEGQQGVITFSRFPGQEWIGTIRRMPYPYGTGGGTRTLEDADTSVRISLDGDLSEMELGDRAQMVVVLEEKEEALWLPPEAIRTFQGRKFVIVQDEDRQRRVDVRLGIESRERVELLEGLEEGQIIVGQ